MRVLDDRADGELVGWQDHDNCWEGCWNKLGLGCFVFWWFWGNKGEGCCDGGVCGEGGFAGVRARAAGFPGPTGEAGAGGWCRGKRYGCVFVDCRGTRGTAVDTTTLAGDGTRAGALLVCFEVYVVWLEDRGHVLCFGHRDHAFPG